MRVLLTGATGFVGSHVLRRLMERDIKTAILMRRESDAWRIADVLSHTRVIHGDLLVLLDAADDIKTFAPETTIHLAWRGVSNRRRNDPQQVMNLQATLALLEIVRAAGCRNWIALGSQAEYGIYNAIITEEMPTRPSTLYGTAKLCACLLAQRLCELYEIRFAWLRLFSVFGPADEPNWLIPYVICTLLRGERPALTPGEQRWDYLYVEDAAEAIVRAAMMPDVHGIFNLASGKAHTVRSIVEMIRDAIDPTLPLGFGEIPYQPDQIMHLQADISRLQNATGWKPRFSIEDGLRYTIEWYKKHTLPKN